MKYFNINNPVEKVSLERAVMKSISTEAGLYLPEQIPKLPRDFTEELSTINFQSIALEVSKAMMKDDITENDLKKIIDNALTFSIPLKALSENLYVLELFHGPTLAFKDVGARFMAGLFEYFLQNESKEVTILVATSGDTGSAVANAFYNKKGINVLILYPSGKVSELQEKQLTTMGGNITALEVDGNFDDCQKMVKQAFSDVELNKKLILTSANSINFARLFPQSFYYFYAVAQLGKVNKPVVISVPSGNFGNLTAGLIAKKMGLNIHRFVASTNSNHAVPDYLINGKFMPATTQYTISNAMDVGNPSNFPRILKLYNDDYNKIAEEIKGYWFTDDETRVGMREIISEFNYQADPHGTIGYLGLKKFGIGDEHISIFLETAHPAKFPEEVEKATNKKVEIPSELSGLKHLEKKAKKISAEYKSLLKELV
ncbi:MAG: threonine synthase [Bacteroidia bacterium]